ncbi:MAG: hypothetical protein KGL35_08335 [Bradyrhizobium sp.]|nr:hypothetical protein [Bradyrhizobium sp.]
MSEPFEADAPIKPLRWTASGMLQMQYPVFDHSRLGELTEAEARKLHQELERLLDERD